MEETENTTISIAGRAYPLILSKKEVVMARMVEARINETFNKLQIDYKITDKLDCLALTLVTLQLESETEDRKNVHHEENIQLEKSISEIEALLKL